jgi:phosphosulfolactate synthase
MAKGEGLMPIPEAGQKDNEDWTRSTAHVIRQIEDFKKAGAWKVLFQDEGVSRDFKNLKSEFILNVVSRFEVDDFLFQLKNTSSQGWFVETFGNGVNLDVDYHQVLEVELMRRGIRKRGLFGLLGSLPPSQ